MLHPGWAVDVGLRGKPHVFGNVAPYVSNASTPADFAGWANASIDPSVTWKDVEWVKSQWGGPLIIKGILDREDALQSVNCGADGIVVSNHGGRQLDGVSSSLRALPPIAEAVSGKTLILMDGGIRSGQDILKALASGADFTMMGRPWVYALAGAGEKGLANLLSAMKGELTVSMALTGITSVNEASGELLFRP